MLARFTLSVAVLFCSVASADEIAVLLPDAPKSYLVTIDAQGVAVVFPLKSMIRPGPAPTPIPPSPPDVLTERAKAIKAAAEKATSDPDRANTAKGLAALYREIAKLVRQPGQVKDEQSLASAVSVATNTFLSSRDPKAAPAWQPTRDLFGTQWTVLKARQSLLVEYAILLDEVANGLDASAPNMRGISPEMLQFIMQIIQLILTLLKPV
jgi:hypothetical protein